MYNVLQQKKTSLGKKFPFRTKKRPKNGFFEVFTSALDYFRKVMFHTMDNQTDKITAHLEAQGVETKERQLYTMENCVLGLKTSKKGHSLRFSRSALKHFGTFVCASDDAGTH